MKKIILVSILVIMCISITACTETHELNLSMSYDNETQTCIIENIDDRDYKDIVVKISLKGKDGFVKNIEQNIGDLKEGEKTSFKLSGITEETQIENVVLESFDYYVETWTEVILPTLIAIVIIVLIIAIAIDVFEFAFA